MVLDEVRLVVLGGRSDRGKMGSSRSCLTDQDYLATKQPCGNYTGAAAGWRPFLKDCYYENAIVDVGYEYYYHTAFIPHDPTAAIATLLIHFPWQHRNRDGNL
mmetsp:Transcript_24879/g.44791  ORF Transcript_24879/g.44791 Transcript_24879/m.44791 type:complete len:103 (+) Transcript_24879:1734-2042(+)